MLFFLFYPPNYQAAKQVKDKNNLTVYKLSILYLLSLSLGLFSLFLNYQVKYLSIYSIYSFRFISLAFSLYHTKASSSPASNGIVLFIS